MAAVFFSALKWKGDKHWVGFLWKLGSEKVSTQMADFRMNDL